MTLKRIAPLFGILILMGGLFLLSKGMQHTSVPDTDDDAAPAVTSTNPTPQPRTMETPISEDLPPEMTLGNPATATQHITIGWIYDPNVMGDPEAVVDIMEAVAQYQRQSQGTVSVQEANVDVPKQDRSPAYQSLSFLGIAVDGSTSVTVHGKKFDLSGNPGEGNVTLDKVDSLFRAMSN